MLLFQGTRYQKHRLLHVIVHFGGVLIIFIFNVDELIEVLIDEGNFLLCINQPDYFDILEKYNTFSSPDEAATTADNQRLAELQRIWMKEWNVSINLTKMDQGYFRPVGNTMDLAMSIFDEGWSQSGKFLVWPKPTPETQQRNVVIDKS